MDDAPLSAILIQVSIKTKNQLMMFSDSRQKDYTDTDISTGSYIVFYQGGPIDTCTHVSDSLSQSSADRE